jgi:hypothetical protein
VSRLVLPQPAPSLARQAPPNPTSLRIPLVLRFSLFILPIIAAFPRLAAAQEPAAEPASEAAAAARPLPEPRAAVAQVLQPRRFDFCHNPEYALTPSEKQWCDLGAAKNTAACPTLAEACRREAMAKQLDDEHPLTIKLPDLGLPLRLLLWLLLGLGLGFLLFALIRHFLDHKQKDVVRTEAPVTAEDEAAAALARQVETDVQRLLERARAEAAAGDFRAAIGSAYAALLRRLEGAGVVRVEADRTNGDYLGMVRKERPAVAARVAEVVDTVELAQFGHVPVTREGFEGVWLRVTGLLAERIGLLLLVASLGVAVACGQPRADWDHSPSGRAGVIGFLGKRGFSMRERLLSVAKIGEAKEDAPPDERETEQLVLLPGAQLGDDEWKALRRWLGRGGRSLVIAGGRRELPAWVGMRIVAKPAAASQPIVPSDADGKRWGALRAVVPAANHLECDPESENLLERGKTVYAAQRWLGDDEDGSRVVVVADDLLFRNASLLLADNAAVLDALLRDGGLANEVAGDLTGLVASNPIESVQRGRLGPALLQLAAFLVLFFVCKGARFGRPTDTQRIRRRELAEHVRALGLHYARARADRFALGTLGAYAVERLRERFGLHVDRSLSGLAEAVAARTGRPVGAVMRLLVEARDAGRGVAADQEANDFESAVELVKLLEETGGTRGHQHIPNHV